MPKKQGSRVQATGPASRDIQAIVEWTIEKFGEAAARRYHALIRQALRDIEANPERLGSKVHTEFTARGVRSYHIKLSRTRVTGSRVANPRHFIAYWRREDGVVEVLRILHDGRDLERHLSEPDSRQ